MKKIYVLAICCILLTFAGCSDVSFGIPMEKETDDPNISLKEETKNISFSSKEETENVTSSISTSSDNNEIQATESNTSDNDPDLYLKDFSFKTNLNAFLRKGDKMQDACQYVFEVPTDKNLSLSLLTSVVPDKSIEIDAVPMRLYTFGDDKPLKFRLKNSNDNASSELYSELKIEKSKDTRIDIDVDLSDVEDIKTITIICDYLPDSIPQKGCGSYSGFIIYSMTNKKYVKETETDEDGDKSLYYKLSCEDFFIDIGVNSLEDARPNNGNYTYNPENHFYEDVDLNGKSKALYVKYNSGSRIDIPYYMILFCDGMLLDAFDGEYSKKVNCHSGERSFQFRIPDKYIPQDGLHTFYAITFPVNAYNYDSEIPYINIYTIKTRVRS